MNIYYIFNKYLNIFVIVYLNNILVYINKTFNKYKKIYIKSFKKTIKI